MKPVTTIEQWIDQVTAPFPVETALKLRREFQAHYEDTLDALKNTTEDDARTGALRSLGDVQSVQEQLRDSYFTAGELEWLKQDSRFVRLMTTPFTSWKWGLGLLFALVFPLLLLFTPDVPPRFTLTDLLTYWVFVLAFAALDAVIHVRWNASSGAVLRRLLDVVAFPVAYVIVGLLITGQDPWLMLFAVAVGVGLQFAFFPPQASLALFRKALRNVR